MQIDNNISSIGFPAPEISAGCAFATTWTQSYASDGIDTRVKRYLKMSNCAFVDNIVGSGKHEGRRQLTFNIVNFAEDLAEDIEIEKESRRVFHKTALLTSDNEILGMLVRPSASTEAQEA